MPWDPRWLDPLPANPEPVSRACGTGACRFWAWPRRRRHIAAAGAPPCCCLPTCPSGAAAPPSSDRTPCRCCRRQLHSPRFIGWLGGFRPLPIPVRPPLALRCPWWPLRGFHPPGTTRPLRGCQCPAATRLPLALPGGPLPGFLPFHRPRRLLHLPSLLRACSPLRWPHGPPLRLPLHSTCPPSFPTGRKPSPLPWFSPHGGLLLLPHWRLWRWPSQFRSHRMSHPLVALPLHSPVYPTCRRPRFADFPSPSRGLCLLLRC